MSAKLSQEELVLLFRENVPHLFDRATLEKRDSLSSSRRLLLDASAAARAGVDPGRGESPRHLGGGFVRLRGLLALRNKVSINQSINQRF